MFETLECRRLLSGTIINEDPVVAADETPLGTLVPTLFSSLPSSAVSGGRVKGASAVVTVANTDSVTYNGPVTVTLFTSTDPTLDPAIDAQITSVTRRLKIESAQAKAVKLKVTSFPSVSDGDYVVIAQVSSPTVPSGINTNDEAIRISAPFVDLSGTLDALPATVAKGKRARLALTVNNAGNVDARGTVPLTIAVSADPSGSGAVTIATVNAKLNVKPNASRPLRLNFTVAADAPSGAHFVVVTLGSLPIPVENNLTNNTVLSGTALAIT